MKTSILLAASISLAFATCAFAQDDTSSTAGSADTAAAAPADQSADMSSADMKKPAKMHKKHAMKHHHAAVAGDPMHIDHSDDHMVVTPPVSHMTVPPASK